MIFKEITKSIFGMNFKTGKPHCLETLVRSIVILAVPKISTSKDFKLHKEI